MSSADKFRCARVRVRCGSLVLSLPPGPGCELRRFAGSSGRVRASVDKCVVTLGTERCVSVLKLLAIVWMAVKQYVFAACFGRRRARKKPICIK